MKAANRATLTGYPVLFLMGLSATAPYLSIRSILALPGSLSLLLALYAGLFIMFATPCISKDTGAGALTLPTLEGALQGFIFTNMNFH